MFIIDVWHFNNLDMASKDPEVWMKWLEEVEEEEVFGEADSDDDYCEESDHNTESEHDNDETAADGHETWFD